MPSSIGDIFSLNSKHANLDVYYGPYTSKEEANLMVPRENRELGLTVGIKQFIEDQNGTYVYREKTDWFTNLTYHVYEEGTPISEEEPTYSFYEVEEYLWKRNIDTLEKKGESSLIIQLLSNTRIKVSENTPISIEILGGVTPNSIEVYEVINSLEYITNYHYPGTIPLNSPISLNLGMSGAPRTIIYRIKVTDKNNLYAKTITDANYVEVIVDFKEIELYNVNISSIEGLLVKNANNLLSKTFTFNVGYIEIIQSYTPHLYIGDTEIIGAVEPLLELDRYLVTLPSNLTNYGGQDITVKVTYFIQEDETEYAIENTIVTIMAKNVFSNIKSELSGSLFYLGNKVPCRIYFEAETQGTYRIASTPDSDFSYSGQIMSYSWNTIYINPEVLTDSENPRTPNFQFIIDGIKKWDIEATKGSKIIAFLKTIFNDGELRIPEDPRTEGFKSSNETPVTSFILDLRCFINWTADTKAVFSLGNITINKEAISFGNISYPTPLQLEICLGFEYLVTDKVLVDEGESRVIYNALYIDGVLCKNVVPDEEHIEYSTYINNFSATSAITILNINIYKNTSAFLSPFTTRPFEGSNKYIPIIQSNYEYYTMLLDVVLDLPVLELEALPMDHYLYDERNRVLAEGGSKPIVPSKFGTLEDGLEKYPADLSTLSGDEYNILLKLGTDNKDDLQKSRGVLCAYTYKIGNTPIDSGYTEVHTLGTSTLLYRLPNFKFTFLADNMKTKKVLLVPGFSESKLTAKTDYMDSSHLNNTPTATFYNKVISSGIFLQGADVRSPSAKIGGLDAITGIPIIMSIKDVEEPDYVNYGSFMLNIDKTGKALKFLVEDEIDECISFEGTSNALESGFSSRFVLQDSSNGNLILDFEALNSILNNSEVPDSSFYSTIITADDGSILYVIRKTDLETNATLRRMVRVLSYLKEGLEYRYPDGDILKEKVDSYNIMPIPHFRRLFKMFYWVARSSSLTQLEYTGMFEEGALTSLSLFTIGEVNQTFIDSIESHSEDLDYPFSNYNLSLLTKDSTLSATLLRWIYRKILDGRSFSDFFSYDYCALYFVFLMIFAQTDNLGKNCMFDLWFDADGEHSDLDCKWYPRPYDLDSLAGLNNNGEDYIAPYVEISPLFSMNYDRVVNTWNTTAELLNQYPNLIDYLNDNNLGTTTKLSYIGGKDDMAERYSFSSSTSNLWFNFYKNYKLEIRNTYKQLRNYKVNSNLEGDENGKETLLSLNTILNFYKLLVIDKLGNSLYNLDFQLKYLGDPLRQHLGLGSRWNKFKSWMETRILFCDVFFYYRLFNVELSAFSTSLVLNSPLYVITRYTQGNNLENIHFFDGYNPIDISLSGSSGTTATSGLKYIFYINPEAIIQGNIYSALSLSDPKLPLNSIVTLSISGDTLSKVINIQGASFLSSLSINNLKTDYNLLLPRNIRNITLTNSTALLTIANLAYILSIKIKDCNAGQRTLNLENLGTPENPIQLSIENSSLNIKMTNVHVQSFTSTNNTINSIDINNCTLPALSLRNLNIGTIGFSGNSSNIDIIDLRESTFTSPTIDLSIVASNVKHLLLASSKGLRTITSDTPFRSLRFFSLMDSDVENFVYLKEGDNTDIDHFDGKLLPFNLPKVVYCRRYTEGGTNSSESYTTDITYNQTYDDYYATNTPNNNTAPASRAFNLELTKIVKIINLNIYVPDYIVTSNSGVTTECLAEDTGYKLVDESGSIVNGNSDPITKLFTNCRQLTTIENSYIHCSGVKMFKNCTSLSSMEDTRINIGIDASYMFATCNSFPYNDPNDDDKITIDKILSWNPQILNFNRFLFNVGFADGITIDLSKYPNAVNMTYAFHLSTHGERGFVLSSAVNGAVITISDTLPSSVTTLSSTFSMGSGNYKVFDSWNTLISGCTSLRYMDQAFYAVEGLNGSYYTIGTGWFPDSDALELQGCFAYAHIKLAPGFKFKNNVINCKSVFYSCPTSDSYDFDVSDIFSDCARLKSAILCFYNCAWAKTTKPLALNQLAQTIVLAGIFACSSASLYPTIDGRISGSNYTTYNSSIDSYNSPYSSAVAESSESSIRGIFEGRKVRILNNTATTYSGATLSNLFRNSIIQIVKVNLEDEAVFRVTLVSRNINRAFYDTNIEGATLNVTLTATVNANYAFYLSSTNNRTYYKFPEIKLIINPPALPSTIQQASRMFYNLSINSIPENYFRSGELFFLNLTDTSYMFYCTKLTALPRNATYGLLPPCISNMDYMFYNCNALNGGIPKNFFNTNGTVTTLLGMFGRTEVLFNIDPAYQEDYYTPLSLKELTPNVKNVTELFYYNYGRKYLTRCLLIKNDCFENCNVLSRLFMYSQELVGKLCDDSGNATTEFKLTKPSSLDRAFVGYSSSISFSITDCSALSNLLGIFNYLTSSTSYTPTNYSSSAAYGLLLLISTVLSQYYSGNYATLTTNVALDSCLGRWNIDTLYLNGIVPEDNNYSAADNWFNNYTGVGNGRSLIN